MELLHIAQEVRQAVGHEDVAPITVEAIIEYLPEVTIERCPGLDTGLLYCGRHARIFIGRAWHGRDYVERLWHEVCHWLLLREGCGNPRPAVGGNHHRLRRLWDAREEADCKRLVRLLRLPSALCLEYPDDYELAELTGCSLEMIRERREELSR